LRKTKNAKAPGPDEVLAEAWKMLGDPGIRLLTAMFNKITEEEKIPPRMVDQHHSPHLEEQG